MKLRFRQCEDGNAALYTLLLLPFALLLTAVAVDVSGWNALRDKLQQEADRLAFQALGGLPQAAEVRSRVESSSSELRRAGIDAEVFFPAAEGSAVGVTLDARYDASFDFLLRPLLRDAFRVRRSAVAQIIPGDYVLIVADGGTLRPPLLPTAFPNQYEFSSWGNSLDWPASRYFDCVSAPVLGTENELGWSWWKDWSNVEFQRWATQSCFNPVLTPLKLASISLAESLLRYRANRVAVLFTPGEVSDRGFRAVRSIHGAADSPAIYPGQTGGFVPASGRIDATWGNYLELDRFLGDEVCMLLTQPEAGLTPRYEFPAGPTSSVDGCLTPLESPPCGRRHFASGHLAECYRDEVLSLRDAIYWNAAKLPLPGFQARPDILSALRRAWGELADERNFAAEKSIRGNLTRNALRQVFVLTDFLPTAGTELVELLEAFHSRGIEVVVVPFFHDGLPPVLASELQSAISSWRTAAESYKAVLRVTPAASPEELEQSVAPRLLTNALQFALRS